MTKVIAKEFSIDRRTLLKWSAAAVIAGKAVDFDEVLAAGECKVVTPDKAIAEVADSILKSSPTQAGAEFLYWIDGPLNDELPGYASAVTAANRLVQRGRLACTVNVFHNATTYIESVTLVEKMGSTPTILAQSFYGPGASLTQTGMAPYTVFENINFDSSKTYQVIYVKNNGAGMPVTVYQYTLVKPRPSRFDYTHLLLKSADEPQGEGHLTQVQVDGIYLPWLVKELKRTNQYHPAAEPLTPVGPPARSGYPTTPFSGTLNDDTHTARARIIKIHPAGSGVLTGDFEIEIDCMHGDDSSDAHYMRYFLVLDPVGRVLGGVRRNFGDGVSGTKVLVRRGFHTPYKSGGTAPAPTAGAVERYSHNGFSYYDLYGTSSIVGAVPAFDDALKAKYINSINILDCPYVQILTDDRQHAIARCVMRLR